MAMSNPGSWLGDAVSDQDVTGQVMDYCVCGRLNASGISMRGSEANAGGSHIAVKYKTLRASFDAVTYKDMPAVRQSIGHQL